MDSWILKKGDELGSIYDKPNRKGRKDYSIDYRVKGVRKRERVGFSKREAQEALESRLTDIRQKFEGVFPETHAAPIKFHPGNSDKVNGSKPPKAVPRGRFMRPPPWRSPLTDCNLQFQGFPSVPCEQCFTGLGVFPLWGRFSPEEEQNTRTEETPKTKHAHALSQGW